MCIWRHFRVADGVSGIGMSMYRTSSDSGSLSPTGVHDSHAVFWLGQVSYRTDLHVHAHKRLQLSVGVSRPGVYNLSVIQVYAGSDDVITSSAGDVTMTRQRPYGPSLLVVNNAVKSMQT